MSEFGDDDLRAGGVDAGDGGEVADVLVFVGLVEELRDPFVEGADLAGVVVDLFEVVGYEVAVVVGEVAREGLGELFVAGFDPGVREPREYGGVPGAGDQGLEDGASGRAGEAADDAGEFYAGVLECLLQPLDLAAAQRGQSGASPGQIAYLAYRFGGMNEPRRFPAAA